MSSLHSIPRETPSFTEMEIKGFEALRYIHYTQFCKQERTSHGGEFFWKIRASDNVDWIEGLLLESWGRDYYDGYRNEADARGIPWITFDPSWIVVEE